MHSYTPERWAVLSELLGDALLRPEQERADFLTVACAGNEVLREDVERLLESYRKAESTGRFDRGALDIVPLAFPEAQPPAVLGPYRLVKEVGRGGMGSVWMAERADGVYDQKVAVKMMRAGFLPEDARRRFETERRILARLNHPNIARILDGGVAEGGQPYLVMEYVDALTITDYCRHHALNVDERLRLFVTVCETVAYAHQNLIVHRDLKPSNILVTEKGNVKLLDFGIAKLLSEDDSDADGVPLTRTGMALMTPEYAAPEQVRGDAVTTATDVYSLGIVLFELLTGYRPYGFDSRTPSAIEQVICHSEPTRPSTAVQAKPSQAGIDIPSDRLARRLRGDLDTIILKALRKEPDRRYPAAAQLAEDLQKHASGLPVSARRDTAGYRIHKFAGRHRVGVVAGAVVLLALITGLIVSLTQVRIAEAQRERADVVNAFLQEMLASPDPYADGPSVRVADVLDRAGASLSLRFSGRPDLEATLRKTLGTSYMELGMYEKADTHLRHSLNLVSRHGLREETGSILASLGSLKKKMGDYDAADSLLTRALEHDLRRYGTQHERTAERLGQVGALRWEQGEYEAADSLLVKSLAILEKHASADSLAVSLAVGHLATLRADQGYNEEAELLHRRALAIQRKAYGSDHPEIPQTLSHIGIIRDDLEDLDAARALHSEALELFRRIRGERHPDVAYAMSNLASVEMKLGNHAIADSLQQAAITLNIEHLGETHPTIGILHNNIGTLKRQRGDVEGALESYRQAVAIWRESLPPDHPYLGYGLHNIGAVLLSLDRITEAVHTMKEAYDLRIRLLDHDHPDRANTASIYGEALARMGRIAAADSLLVQSHLVLQNAFGEDHPATMKAAERLAWFLEEFGSAAEQGVLQGERH